MSKECSKKAMIETLDLMILQADKGPSGFWTDDYEGCGNPAIFPEFEDGLKRGKLVQKEHYLCPWNTSVLYGSKNGDISNGCYYNCSINRVRCLRGQELRDVLIRFKTRLQKGDYDDSKNLPPLLTKYERKQIEERIRAAQEAKKKEEDNNREKRLKAATNLIAKFPEQTAYFGMYYGENNLVFTYDGTIDFNPDGFHDIVGAEKFTYDEYLSVQIQSFGKQRDWFATCYYNYPVGFMGKIERMNKNRILFSRIFVDGMYSDGSMFEGKEDHVWMDQSGFESMNVGDSLSFSAEIYRYVKTGNGKQIEYGLRNPTGVKKIGEYTLPSDDELKIQEINQILCETCYLSEQCNRVSCLRNKKELRLLRQQLFEAIKSPSQGVQE